MKNNFTKNIDNNKKVCYVRNKEEQHTKEQVTAQLRKIFSGMGYSYNIPVRIKTKTNTYNTSLIAKTSTNVVTLDNDVIPIQEIEEIEIKKN